MPKRMKKHRMSSFQTIITGFAVLIIAGTLLLMLPLSSVDRTPSNLSDALFTATSAVCVTGLVALPTAVHWSLFGQVVILLLIQAGGLGVVTVAASFALISGRKISVIQRDTIQEAISAQKTSGVVRLIVFILKVTLAAEFTGALIMMPVFCRAYGARGIWVSVFHAVSAFCNAGFDLTGTPGAEFASLSGFAANPAVNLVIIFLIVFGGIGFLTWEDIRTQKFHLPRYSMQSKVILTVTGILITVPALLFFFLEFRHLPLGERVLASLFQSVTPRTAGFNTESLNDMSGAGKLVMIALMFIGGAPGSTAGGMKVTTAAVLFANARAVFARHEDVRLFDRRIPEQAIRNASTIFLLDIVLTVTGAAIISSYESIPFQSCLYEAVSAVGTVGLSLGITPHLHLLSRCVLMFLMFFGRVGGLTVIYAAISGRNISGMRYPLGQITTG